MKMAIASIVGMVTPTVAQASPARPTTARFNTSDTAEADHAATTVTTAPSVLQNVAVGGSPASHWYAQSIGVIMAEAEVPISPAMTAVAVPDRWRRGLP